MTTVHILPGILNDKSSSSSSPPLFGYSASSAFPAMNTLLFCNSSILKPSIYTIHHHHHNYNNNINIHLLNQVQNRRLKNRRCRAVLLHDAPFAGAIGACILNSLIFPLEGPTDDEDGESMIDPADARFSVMGIISFIPYFNWMSWVFALMDTGDKRYAAYAIVYLAPYLRSNLSLLTDESWLPVASILLGILHIQLEASIKNGDILNLPLFKRKKHEQGTRKDEGNLASAINKLRYWRIPKMHTAQVHHLDEDGEEGGKH